MYLAHLGVGFKFSGVYVRIMLTQSERQSLWPCYSH